MNDLWVSTEGFLEGTVQPSPLQHKFDHVIPVWITLHLRFLLRILDCLPQKFHYTNNELIKYECQKISVVHLVLTPLDVPIVPHQPGNFLSYVNLK